MIYLFSEEGREALRSIVTSAMLYAFDFDGTLAPISADRNAVLIAPGTAKWLQELTKRASCAVVSGRALADVMPRIDGVTGHVIGNHGIENPFASAADLMRAAEICTGWRQQLLTSFAQSMTSLGAEIEDKRYSMTVHFRRAANPAKAASEALVLLGQLTPEPHLLPGKYAINALPPGQGGKGLAAVQLMTYLGLNGIFYMGDEETDESVFALSEGLMMGVRVGKHVGSHAKFYLHHQGEVEEVLRFLVQKMDHISHSSDAETANPIAVPDKTKEC
jgi:trehalose 6-phosphate phosphatase